MACYVRLMGKKDADQVTEIDRDTLSTQWPPPNYQRELQNQLAHYIVACDEDKVTDEVASSVHSWGFASRLRRLFGHQLASSDELASSSRHNIVGFVGFWVMADEAHITSIAVREAYRRRGIGELLLLPVFDLAAGLEAHVITLEVRVSNTVAQNLYIKYGFSQTGIRHGYYTDNREDALVMSTDDITTGTFLAHLEQLKEAHSRKWGITLHQTMG